MPFEAAKCPNCGAPIQVPSEIEAANCMYCGSKIIVKEAIQRLKVEFSGIIKAEVNIESLLKSAEGFLALGKWSEAKEIYSNITKHDSTDFRAWWGLFMVETFNMTEHGSSMRKINIGDAVIAIKLAPEDKKDELKKMYSQYINNAPQLFSIKIDISAIQGIDLSIANENGTDIWDLYKNENSDKIIALDLPLGKYDVRIESLYCLYKVKLHVFKNGTLTIKPKIIAGGFKMIAEGIEILGNVRER